MINWTKFIQDAMKLKDKTLVEAYRSMKKRETEFQTRKNAKELTENDQLDMIRKEVSELKDELSSLLSLQNRGNSEKIEYIQGKIDVLQMFLPMMYSREDTISIVEDVIKSTNAQGMKDMGKVMKELKGLKMIDSRIASEIVKEKLK